MNVNDDAAGAIRPDDLDQLVDHAQQAACNGDEWAKRFLDLAPMALDLRDSRDAAEALCVALVVELGGEVTITQEQWTEAEGTTVAVGVDDDDSFRFRAVPA